MSDRNPAKTCSVDGCAAWKMGDKDVCYHHGGASSGPKTEDGKETSRMNATKTGLEADPVNLFDYLAEHDEVALAYIIGKLHDYAERAPEAVFVADVTDAESFEDIETSLTAYGDDVLFMCIRDYARKRAQKRQLEQGLVTEQTRSGESGTYTVEEENPVNLGLDRMDKTTMRQKDKLGLLPSPEAKQADAMNDLAAMWEQDLAE
jgi:hypothetical protein